MSGRTVREAEVAAAYDSRAAEYLEIAGDISQMDPRDQESIAAWRDATSGRLLDAGCGPGHWTDFLHDGHRDVTGIDLSEEFLAAARELHLHLRFDRGSFHDLPYEGASFGGILAWYSLIHTHPDDVPAVLAEFTRVLTPGGSLFLGYFDGPPREQFAHAVASAYFWSAGALSELLADAGLTVISHERRDRTPAEVSRRPHGALTARRL